MAFGRKNDEIHLRTDDFRCHDSSLVKIDPTRIDDAYHCAVELHDQGIVSGVYVSGDGFSDFDFVERFNFLDSFYFHDLEGVSLKRLDFQKICNARVLSLRGERISFDLTAFQCLEELYCNWFDDIDLSGSERLQFLQLFSLNRRDGCLSLALPKSVIHVELVRVRACGLEFPNVMPCLTRFGLYYTSGISNIQSLLASSPSLVKLELENVVGDFDYSCLARASSLRELSIDKSSRISDWEFLKSLVLERFVLQQTKYEDVDFSNEEFSRIADLHVPRKGNRRNTPA